MSRAAIGYRPAPVTRLTRVQAASGLQDAMLGILAESAGYQLVEIVCGQDDEHAAIDALISLVTAREAKAIFVDGGRAAFLNSRNREILVGRCRELGIELFD